MRSIIRPAVCLLLATSAISSCKLESPETTKYTENNLTLYAQQIYVSNLIFPVVMAETALAIEPYNTSTPEEKMDIEFLFHNLLQESSTTYRMTNFHNLTIETDGNSIYREGASWELKTQSCMFDIYSQPACKFILTCIGAGKWEIEYHLDGQAPYKITLTDNGNLEAFYSWKIECSGEVVSPKGLITQFGTYGVYFRDVFRGKSDSPGIVWTDGVFFINILSASREPLDNVSRRFENQSQPNAHYTF